MAPHLSWLKHRKHGLLLASLVALLFVQPLAQRSGIGEIAFGLSLSVTVVVVFLAVFDRYWTRLVGLILAGVTVSLHWLRIAGAQTHVGIIGEHLFTALFLGFAVAVILEGIFRSKRISSDAILGAVCGYVLAALAWGNLYYLVETISPGSFVVRPDAAWQLHDEPTKRYLFDYFSFITMTCYGDSRVTPLAPAASSLTLLETLFGQFYMAVVVAQLVGLKLTQAIESRGQ